MPWIRAYCLSPKTAEKYPIGNNDLSLIVRIFVVVVCAQYNKMLETRKKIKLNRVQGDGKI